MDEDSSEVGERATMVDPILSTASTGRAEGICALGGLDKAGGESAGTESTSWLGGEEIVDAKF